MGLGGAEPNGGLPSVTSGRSAAELVRFFADVLPEVQVCDLYPGQLASPVPQKAVCQAHQLRDLRYAAEAGDAPRAAPMGETSNSARSEIVQLG